jgi:peptidoglycan/LPS O-acetylase OafA/YrhL
MIPLLLLIVGPTRFLPMVVILALVAPFLRLAMPGFGSNVNMPFRMDTLLIGVILAGGFRSENFVRLLSANKPLLWGVFLVLLYRMGLITFQGIELSFFDFSVIAIFYASFITLVLLYRDTNLTAILRSKVLVRLGLYSYGLYMYHQMVAGLIHGYFRGSSPSMESGYSVILTILSLIVTVAIALISFHTYEAFALSIGRRYKYDTTDG